VKAQATRFRALGTNSRRKRHDTGGFRKSVDGGLVSTRSLMVRKSKSDKVERQIAQNQSWYTSSSMVSSLPPIRTSFAGRAYTVPYPGQLAVFKDLSHTQYFSPHRTAYQVAPIKAIQSTAVMFVCMYMYVSDVM